MPTYEHSAVHVYPQLLAARVGDSIASIPVPMCIKLCIILLQLLKSSNLSWQSYAVPDLFFMGSYVVQLKTTWLQIFVAKFSGASNSEVMHFHCKVCSLKYRVVLP